MAFDEKGQADTVERKGGDLREGLRAAHRADRLRAAGHRFRSNIFAVATGIEEHNRYSLDFIEATAAIKRRMPACHVSGGVSNVSFSFRGNDPVREAMHSCSSITPSAPDSPWGS